MYALKPLGVYVLDEVLSHDLASARLHRMLDALGMSLGDVTIITDENLPEVVGELQSLWPPDDPPADVPIHWTRPLVFTLQQLEGEAPDYADVLARCPEGTSKGTIDKIHGWIKPKGYRTRESDRERNLVCWTAWEFNTHNGCPHGCQYCGAGKSGKFITVGLNLEEYVEQVVGPTLTENPWQKCFRMIGEGADQIAFEPEYGMFDLATRKCAEFGDRYMIFHTKAANVDWLADLEHKDHVICLWSVCGEECARIIEPSAASSIERFEAARKCQEMGLSVRFKFKPFVPIRNWREDAAKAVENLFAHARPDSIGMTVLMWMNAERLRSLIDPELLDPEFVAAMDEAEEDLRGVQSGPFPLDKRLEVYRFMMREIRKYDKDVKLYVSTEAPDVWHEIGEELGQDARAFLCGCGPVALPGAKLGLSGEFKCSTYCREGFPD